MAELSRDGDKVYISGCIGGIKSSSDKVYIPGRNGGAQSKKISTLFPDALAELRLVDIKFKFSDYAICNICKMIETLLLLYLKILIEIKDDIINTQP